MDYPCGKFDDCSFSCFWFYRAESHTDRQTDADERLTLATVVGVNKYGTRVRVIPNLKHST